MTTGLIGGQEIEEFLHPSISQSVNIPEDYLKTRQAA